MTAQTPYCGFNTGMEEGSDRVDAFESELIRHLRQSLADAGAILCDAENDGIAQLHIPFSYGGASLGLAVILVGMVPTRWLVSITGETMDDSPGDLDVSWLRTLIESVVAQVCDSPVRWYASLEDVPMA